MPVKYASFALHVAALAFGAVVAACGSDEAPAAGEEVESTAHTGSSTSTGAGAGGGASGATTGAGGSGGEGGSMPTNNGFPAAWPDGTACGTEPDVFVWEYDADTFILRQSLCTHYEGPFFYLLFGDDKVLLEDTGTGDVDLAGTVLGLVANWLEKNGKSSIELVVSHSHGHGDHVGGDSQFAGLAGVTVVGKSASSVQDFFGLADWPDGAATYDLGGRVLDVLPIPGHQSAHIALYDRRSRLLLTGDTLYPGRLYIEDWSAYAASVGRLRAFVEAGNPVDWALGTHIEMKASGGDFALGSDQHPNEHVLQLGPSVLSELADACEAMGSSPSYEEHADFILYPL